MSGRHAASLGALGALGRCNVPALEETERHSAQRRVLVGWYKTRAAERLTDGVD